MLVESGVKFLGAVVVPLRSPFLRSSATFRPRSVAVPSGERAALPFRLSLAILFARVT